MAELDYLGLVLKGTVISKFLEGSHALLSFRTEIGIETVSRPEARNRSAYTRISDARVRQR